MEGPRQGVEKWASPMGSASCPRTRLLPAPLPGGHNCIEPPAAGRPPHLRGSWATPLLWAFFSLSGMGGGSRKGSCVSRSTTWRGSMAGQPGCGEVGVREAAPSPSSHPSPRGTLGEQCNSCVAGPGPRVAIGQSTYGSLAGGTETPADLGRVPGKQAPQRRLTHLGVLERPSKCHGAKPIQSCALG